MKELTILHVLEALGGGTSRHLLDVVQYTTNVRHVVAVPARRIGWLSDDTAVDQLRGRAAAVHIVEMRRFPPHPLNIAAGVTIRRLIDSARPDIVHGHSAVGGAIARLAAWRKPVATLYTPNGINTHGGALMVERSLGHLTDLLIAVSQSEANLAADLGIAPSSRIAVIPNGIDLDPPEVVSDLRALVGVAPGTPLVGCLARLVPQKAPEIFVKACAEVANQRPDVHYVLIGTGLLLGEVESMVQERGLGRCFHRLDDFDDAAAALGQLQVYALPSRYEGGPYTPLEAMRMRTPVVLTDVIGNRDVIEDEVSGLLVPKDDVDALAHAILRLLNDEVLRGRVAIAGRQRLERNFDVRAMGQALDELYRRMA